jgi:hypothetical protein
VGRCPAGGGGAYGARVLRSLVLLCLIGAVAGCGGADRAEPTDPREAFIEAAASAFTSGNSGPALDDGTGRCVGEALVDVVGAPALTAAGTTPQELADAPDLRSLGVPIDPGASAALAAALGACGLGDALAGPYLAAFATESGGPLSDGAARCVDDAIDRSAFEAGLAAGFVDRATGDAGLRAVLDAVAVCPDAMIELVLNGFEQAGGPADDATRGCVEAHVTANRAAAAASFREGGAAATAYGDLLLASCPGLLG